MPSGTCETMSTDACAPCLCKSCWWRFLFVWASCFRRLLRDISLRTWRTAMVACSILWVWILIWFWLRFCILLVWRAGLDPSILPVPCCGLRLVLLDMFYDPQLWIWKSIRMMGFDFGWSDWCKVMWRFDSEGCLSVSSSHRKSRALYLQHPLLPLPPSTIPSSSNSSSNSC